PVPARFRHPRDVERHPAARTARRAPRPGVPGRRTPCPGLVPRPAPLQEGVMTGDRTGSNRPRPSAKGRHMLDVRALRKVYEGHARHVEGALVLPCSLVGDELVCVAGPVGCGKTPLLKCAAGLLAPPTGEVLLRAPCVAGLPPGTAVVFEEFGRRLFAWMRVR